MDRYKVTKKKETYESSLWASSSSLALERENEWEIDNEMQLLNNTNSVWYCTFFARVRWSILTPNNVLSCVLQLKPKLYYFNAIFRKKKNKLDKIMLMSVIKSHVFWYPQIAETSVPSRKCTSSFPLKKFPNCLLWINRIDQTEQRKTKKSNRTSLKLHSEIKWPSEKGTRKWLSGGFANFDPAISILSRNERGKNSK